MYLTYIGYNDWIIWKKDGEEPDEKNDKADSSSVSGKPAWNIYLRQYETGQGI